MAAQRFDYSTLTFDELESVIANKTVMTREEKGAVLADIDRRMDEERRVQSVRQKLDQMRAICASAQAQRADERPNANSIGDSPSDPKVVTSKVKGVGVTSTTHGAQPRAYSEMSLAELKDIMQKYGTNMTRKKRAALRAQIQSRCDRDECVSPTTLNGHSSVTSCKVVSPPPSKVPSFKGKSSVGTPPNIDNNMPASDEPTKHLSSIDVAKLDKKTKTDVPAYGRKSNAAPLAEIQARKKCGNTKGVPPPKKSFDYSKVPFEQLESLVEDEPVMSPANKDAIVAEIDNRIDAERRMQTVRQKMEEMRAICAGAQALRAAELQGASPIPFSHNSPGTSSAVVLSPSIADPPSSELESIIKIWTTTMLEPPQTTNHVCAFHLVRAMKREGMWKDLYDRRDVLEREAPDGINN